MKNVSIMKSSPSDQQKLLKIHLISNLEQAAKTREQND